jgi:hypothetical protein
MKHTLKTLTLTIALLVGSVSVSYAEKNDITKLSCLFEGQGFQTFLGQSSNYDVKIEQTLDFNNSEVTNELFRFISDYDFIEPFTTDDGRRYGWLVYETIVSENFIMFRSKTIGDTMKSSAKNTKHKYFKTELTINRNTGFGVRKMRHEFNEWKSEYNVSGDCKVVTKKF